MTHNTNPTPAAQRDAEVAVAAPSPGPPPVESLDGPALDLAVAHAMEPMPAPVTARELRGPNWPPYSSDERRSPGGWWTADIGLDWADEELVEWAPTRVIEDEPYCALWVAERFCISTVYSEEGVYAIAPEDISHRMALQDEVLALSGGIRVLAETAALAVCRCAVLVNQSQPEEPVAPDWPTIGQRVRCWREARGWTQDEVSRRSKASVPTIRALELGQRGVQADTAWRLCVAFGKEPNAFYGLSREKAKRWRELARRLPFARETL